MVDLILTGATVIDPSQELCAVRDVAITGDRIVELAEDIQAEAKQRIDLSGRILTPGFIDIHAHLYAGSTTWGIRFDALCLATGVTTVVDAGSSGWANFWGFEENMVAPARTQTLAFVHISGIGLTFGPLGELEDIRYACPDRTAGIIKAWPETCVGVKIRMGRFQLGDNGIAPLHLAVEAAEATNTPIMAHLGPGIDLPEVLRTLRPGDVVTHCYHDKGDDIFGDGDRILPAVWEARERGVLFDVGHGGGSFSFDTAKRALAQDFTADVISTDLHSSSLEDPVMSLPETASKLLNLGVPLVGVVRQCTTGPAESIQRADELGTLRPGSVADLAAFELQEGGQFEFRDVHDQLMVGPKNLSPVLTIRAGTIYDPDALAGEREADRQRALRMKALSHGDIETFLKG
ncbi:MAG: amidohydrolase/deacetylase family metallohydrolase [Candidatus Latescibacterota bacterium]|nr:amidohydrolase/deacetylase family metallohydrolase [Candidatus Latescibacterota bacterium]MEE3264469.1 amidohydrolase/deacetylase family metallohydrolase [Candidatus Latescibacterota bacterium]MEE3335761.1 amidohydrolase/deacetylase family metallohydrolase [Candidatus Latescibacterota bacterium]